MLVVDLPRQSRILLSAANSTDNQQDQPMTHSQALQRAVSDNTPVSPASVEHLKQTARNFNIEGQPLQIDAGAETNDSFLDLLPGNLRDVLGNGACLFNCFSFVLSETENYASEIRQLICDKLLTMNFKQNHFVLPDDTTFAVDATSYLTQSNMRCENTFGGPLEIVVFCEITSLDVLVYSVEADHWVWFSTDYQACRQQVYLHHSGFHYQIVTSLSNRNRNRNSNPEKVIEHVMSSFSYSSSKPNFQQPLVESLKEYLSPITGDTADITFPVSLSTDICDKCLRNSTDSYELGIRLYDLATMNVKTKRFGKSLAHLSIASLCIDCHKYVTNADSKFKHAWPCILCSYWTDNSNSDVLERLLQLLPKTIVSLYQQSFRNFSPTFQNVLKNSHFVCTDGTQKRNLILTTKKELKGSQIRSNFNKVPLPDVMCPWGCWEFVERCNSISFGHFIALVDSDFQLKSFNGDKLRGIIPSFPEGYCLLKSFQIRPTVIITEEDGLVFLSCSKHRPDALQYVHPPKNPVLQNISPNKPERLAVAQQQLHIVKSGKPKFNSHSTHLIEERGSLSGISSSTLQFPTFFEKSTPLETISESLIAIGRHDVHNLVNHFLDSNLVDANFVDYLYSSELQLTSEEIKSALLSSTSVSLYDAFKMQMAINKSENIIEDSPFLPIYSHAALDTNCHGTTPIKTFTKDYPFCAVLEAIARFSSIFLNTLFSSTQTEMSELAHLLADLIRSTSEDGIKRAKRRLNDWLVSQCRIEEANYNLCSLKNLLNDLQIPAFDVNSRTRFDSVHGMPTEKKLIFLFPRKKRERDCGVPLDMIHDEGKQYKLFFIGNNFEQANYFCRHASSHNAWFKTDKNSRTFQAIDFPEFYTETMLGLWEFAVYQECDDVTNNKVHQNFLQSIGGQTSFYCDFHKAWLIQSKTCTAVRCYQVCCNNKAKWVCPYETCFTAVCKKHSFDNITNSIAAAITSNKTPIQQTTPHDDQLDFSVTGGDPCHIGTSDEFTNQQLNNIYLPQEFLTSAIESTDNRIPLTSNAGVEPFEYVNDESISKKYPTKVLLNNYLHVLRRAKVPIWTSNSHKNFLQGIVAKNPNTSVPLLFPEALLFPSIFWKHHDDGTAIGALPSFLLQSDDINKKIGFGSVSDHLWCRLTNGSLLTSSNLHYASLAFDIKMNTEMNKAHSTYVLFRRGFEDSLGDDETLQMPNTAIKWDGIESSKRVLEVAEACAEESPGFFLTLTCNMSAHPGIKPLFEAIKNCYGEESSEVYEAVVQSFMGMFVRLWERTSAVIMDYIEKSDEKPLGNVLRIWWRYEFQTTQGNLPHIHCLLWVEEKKIDEKFQDLVVAKRSQLLFALQSTFCKESELVPNFNEAFHLYKEAVRIHYHSCSATNFRCHKKTNEKGESFCRYPVYPTSMRYYHDEIDVNHSDDAFSILQKCGLAHPKEGCYNTLTVADELKAGQWFYPHNKNENITPMSPHLFALTESQNNLLICDKYLSARYIAKYAAGVEEKAQVLISAGSTENKLRVHLGDIENNKIASVQQRLKSEQSTRKRESCQVKHLCITECYWHLFNLPFVRSSFGSVCLHTCEEENRPGIKLTKSRRTFATTHFTVRNTLPSWRQFTASQQRVIEMNIESNISTSNITAHSARPPELLFVTNPKQYFWLFERLPVRKLDAVKLQTMLTSENMHWIDGFGKQVLIRQKRINNFLIALEKSNHVSAAMLKQTFDNQSNFENLVSSNTDQKSNVVVYFSKVFPSEGSKFLIHLLLSMGHFETEFDLFNCTNLKESFIKSGLLSTETLSETALTLTKRYILEQAQFLPGSTRMFDRNVVQCYQVLHEFFEKDIISYISPPRVLVLSVKESRNEKTESFLQTVRSNVAKGLVASKKVLNCPNETLLTNATTSFPLDFEPTISKIQGQSISSYEKQKSVLFEFVSAIDFYLSGNACFIPHQFALGRPGTGKSTVSLIALCYAMCKGLNCLVTTLAGEKAAQHGGLHLHRLIPMPVSSTLPVIKQVESTVQKLYLDPLRLVLLKSLDVLLVEELGMLNSEQWSVLDQTFRFVNNNNLPMGGVLVLGNGDPKQLRPPSGPLLWISPIVLTNFRFFYLKEYVRMMDPNGERLLNLLDKTDLSDEDADEIIQIISDHCNFLTCWNDIPRESTILRVVPTKMAEKKLVQSHTDYITSLNIPSTTLPSSDEISRRGQNLWSTTQDKNAILCLNKNCLEPQKLFLYKGAPMRLTRNHVGQQLSQGQLCVIKTLPTTDATSIELLVAPPCVRDLPPVTQSGERDYAASGWRTVAITRMEGLPHLFGSNFVVRRLQFPLKPFEASTIHKCIGDDVPLLATQAVFCIPILLKSQRFYKELILCSKILLTLTTTF